MADSDFQPRKQPKQARSRFLFDTIVTAAGRVLPRLGLERLTTSDVAEAAGVSVGSLYQYFPTKESIVGVLIERRAREDAERVRHMLEGMRELPVREMIAKMVGEMVALHREARPLYRAMLPLVARVRRHRYVREVIAGMRREIAAELARRGGELRKSDLDVPVFVGGHAFEACLHAALDERPELLDDPAFAAELSDLLARYFVRDQVTSE